MHISRISIRNFRNFQHLDLDKLTPTTVIVGENKVGKSNLIHALRLILDPSLPDSSRLLLAEDFCDCLDRPFAGNIIEVVVELMGFDEHSAAKALLADSLIQPPPMVARLTYQYRPKRGIMGNAITEHDYEFVIWGGSAERSTNASEIRRWVSLMLLPALRDAESEIQNWRRSPLRPLLERLNVDSDRLSQVLQTLNQASQSLLDEEPVRELAEQIAGRVAAMVGEAHGVDTRLGFASTRPDHLLRSVRLFIDGERSRSLTHASLGTANILFLALLMQHIDARKQVRENVTTVLAIEEPEAHLHPHVQRLIFGYFLRSGAPIIVTTHSPHITSVARLNSLVILRTTEGYGTRGYTIRNLDLSATQIADLERYLDVTRGEMLFSRGVILVEGPAEAFLIPAFAESMGYRLDELGITVCSVNGTDFAPYWRLLGPGGLDMPRVVITDGDPRQFRGKLVHYGILRGERLLQEARRLGSSEGMITPQEWDASRRELSKAAIFVGRRTLEIDLLETSPELMLETYSELASSYTLRTSFEEMVNAVLGGDDQKVGAVLARIEDLGKGRFAQRLADKVARTDPPEYIRAALERIVQMVRGHHA